MTVNNCDPRALDVARALHERENPKATILFGSRARGDYDDRRSDIDIMMVNPGMPDQPYKDRTSEWAEGVAQMTYGRFVPVQLVWFSQDVFREKMRYINHVTTQALLDGVVMSSNPEDYQSRYSERRNSDESCESSYEYEWTDYDNRVYHAESHLRIFNTLVDLGEIDLMIAQRAHSALEHAMKAVVAAHGGTYPATHNLARLIGTIRRLDDELREFSLGVSPDIYSEYAGDLEYQLERANLLLTEQPNYRELTVADAQRLIDRARAVRQIHDK